MSYSIETVSGHYRYTGDRDWRLETETGDRNKTKTRNKNNESTAQDGPLVAEMKAHE